MAAEMLTILRRPTRLGALALLEAAQLPTADLSDGHLGHFFYLRSARGADWIGRLRDPRQ